MERKQPITAEKIAYFKMKTGESELVAIDYLEAEEGDTVDALISYRGDMAEAAKLARHIAKLEA